MTSPPVSQLVVMPQSSPSAEIQRFLDRLTYSCSEPEYVSFQQEAVREWVSQVADAHGWEELRVAAIARLSHEDPRMVERALTCLFVVGTALDVPSVEPLVSHSDESVRKAARTCLFELHRRRVDA
jgi:hypothetical protein